MMYYVYILKSKTDDKFYIGYTADLRKRLREHSEGKVLSTKPCRPLKLIFYEAFKSQKDAKRREQYFKTTKGKSSFRQILRESLL